MLTKHAVEFEIKGLSDAGTFEGWASIYGNVDEGGEIVLPGAFTKSLSERREVPILYQHNQKQPIGLGKLEDTPAGLKMYGELVLEVPEAKSAYALMKKGVLKGLSIGYRTVRESFDSMRKANRLEEIDLHEVSVVTFPMNTLAQVTAVKAASEIKSIRDFEEFLRDSGFSKSAATALAASGWKGFRRDADTQTTTEKPVDVQTLAALLQTRTNTLKGLLTWTT
jgi:uncharacterized protein